MAYFMGSTDAPTFDANTVLLFYFAPAPQGEYVPRYYYLGCWSTSGGGGGGSSSYSDLSNKPQINSVTLSGNKSFSDLGVDTYIDTYIAANYENGDSATY